MIHRGHPLGQKLASALDSCLYKDSLGVSMGVVYDQFAQELESWQRKYAGRPRDELIGLCLMALEREELVTVGYREDLMSRRLVGMPLSEPVRELIRHALIWAWRAEEIHTVYIRVAPLTVGNPPLKPTTSGHQF